MWIRIGLGVFRRSLLGLIMLELWRVFNDTGLMAVFTDVIRMLQSPFTQQLVFELFDYLFSAPIFFCLCGELALDVFYIDFAIMFAHVLLDNIIHVIEFSLGLGHSMSTAHSACSVRQVSASGLERVVLRHRLALNAAKA